MKARIRGVAAVMESFEYFFAISLAELLLRHSDNLSKTLQSSSISAAEGQKIAEMTVVTLESIRCDEHFCLFWDLLKKRAAESDIDDPKLPRRRKQPKRYDENSSTSSFPSTVEEYYKRNYFEALDELVNGIRNRFDQPGYRVYLNLEQLLIKAARKCEYEEEFKFVTDFYQDDFDCQTLKLQLHTMSSNFSSEGNIDLQSIISYFKGLSDPQKDLMSQVCKLLSLILVMPATNAVSERSFSCLRRLKSYLRATMTQTRLNNVCVLHVHKTITDQLSLVEMANEFVAGSSHRECQFGNFRETDL